MLKDKTKESSSLACIVDLTSSTVVMHEESLAVSTNGERFHTQTDARVIQRKLNLCVFLYTIGEGVVSQVSPKVS